MNHTLHFHRLVPRILMSLLVLTMLATETVLAQTAQDAFRFSERSPATGARMIGLAGAGTAGLGDYAALFSNPAGLGYLRQSSVSGALNTFYVTDTPSSTSNGFSLFGSDDETTGTTLGNLAYIYKARTRQGSFVMGVAFNQTHSFENRLQFKGDNSRNTISTSFLPLPFGGEYELDGEDLASLADLPFAAFNGGFIEFYPEDLEDTGYPFREAVFPGTNIEQFGVVDEEGRMSELSFGGAIEASRGVMLGLSANMAIGSYSLFSLFKEEDINNENGPDEYTVILDDGSELSGFDALEYRQRLESDLLGINLRMGVSSEVTPSLRLGLTLETPTFYTVTEDYGASFDTFFDDGGSLSYGDHPQDVLNGEFEYDITTPWRLGIGLGYTIANLTLLADAEFVDWSQMELDAETDPDFFFDLNQQIEDLYQPVVNVRLGAEYELNNLFFRGGFAYKPDPVDEDFVREVSQSVDRDRIFFSLGFGYRVHDQFQLDFGWMLGYRESQYLPYPEDGAGPRQDDVLQIDEEILQNQFAIGLNFFF